MPLRLGAFLVAAIVTAAPVSLTTCEILCAVAADRASSADAGAATHSCHQTQPVGAPGALIGLGHVCGHVGQLPFSSGLAGPQLAPHPDLVVVAALPGRGARADRSPYLSATSPPDHPGSRVPLRI